MVKVAGGRLGGTDKCAGLMTSWARALGGVNEGVNGLFMHRFKSIASLLFKDFGKYG